MLFIHINMLGSDVWLQHKHWIQRVSNLKFTNNKSLVTSLLFTGDVSTITVDLLLITDMLAAMKRLWTMIWHTVNNMTHFAQSALFILCKLCAILSSFLWFYKLLHGPTMFPQFYAIFRWSPQKSKIWGGGLYFVLCFYAISITCIMAAVPAH